MVSEVQQHEVVSWLLPVRQWGCALISPPPPPRSLRHNTMKAVPQEQVQMVGFMVNAVLTALPVYSCLYIVADGQFVPAYLAALLLWFR
jgi:hypothetical protein